MHRTPFIRIAVAFIVAIAAVPAQAQQSDKSALKGKHACALLSVADIQKITGRSDVARSAGKPEEGQFRSNCLLLGAFEISVHIGDQTKVMFGRERDTYAKAPAKLGYKIETIKDLGDEAYYKIYSGTVEARAILGEVELAISLTGPVPPEAEAKTMAFNLAKAVIAKLK